jgi:hypothetical protein
VLATPTVAAAPSPTAAIEGVKAPLAGSGGGSGGGHQGALVLIGVAIAALVASLVLFWRFRVRIGT